jgi:hypothetical protein
LSPGYESACASRSRRVQRLPHDAPLRRPGHGQLEMMARCPIEKVVAIVTRRCARRCCSPRSRRLATTAGATA